MLYCVILYKSLVDCIVLSCIIQYIMSYSVILYYVMLCYVTYFCSILSKDTLHSKRPERDKYCGTPLGGAFKAVEKYW